jgi:hypothetical protein
VWGREGTLVSLILLDHRSKSQKTKTYLLGGIASRAAGAAHTLAQEPLKALHLCVAL